MPVYSFGPFVLDPAERRLTRDGRQVAVPAKAWQILLMLVEAGGRLVLHEAFRAKLWPNVVVEDRTLTVHMSTLRKALGDPAPIETVARAGYRLTVPVGVLADADRPAQVVPATEPRTLAVRAFSTGGLDDDDSYLGVGIADAVSTALGAVRGLSVAPVGAVEDVDSRVMGAGHLLEGAVQRTAERLQVTTRLIEVESGRTRRSGRFEQLPANGAALQDEIATWVAASLPEASDVDLRSYRPSAADAYFLQLQARAHLKPFTRLPLLKAHALFEQALALDPDYAMAHAGLGSTYLLMASTAMLRPLPADEAMPLARKAAERAIARDESLAEAWAVQGRVKMEYDWDWEGAEADLAHAVALNGSSVEALGAFGQFLSAMGRHDEAIDYMLQARKLDPRHIETLQHLAIVYWMAGQAERSISTTDECLQIADTPRIHYGRMLLFDQLYRRDEAMAERLARCAGWPSPRALPSTSSSLRAPRAGGQRWTYGSPCSSAPTAGKAPPSNG